MPMAAKGLAKLVEEVGELQTELGRLQTSLGKKLAFYHVDEHPDGGPPLRERLEDEIADVRAACALVVRRLGLDEAGIDARCALKTLTFDRWDADPGNNKHGVDAPAPEGARE